MKSPNSNLNPDHAALTLVQSLKINFLTNNPEDLPKKISDLNLTIDFNGNIISFARNVDQNAGQKFEFIQTEEDLDPINCKLHKINNVELRYAIFQNKSDQDIFDYVDSVLNEQARTIFNSNLSKKSSGRRYLVLEFHQDNFDYMTIKDLRRGANGRKSGKKFKMKYAPVSQKNQTKKQIAAGNNNNNNNEIPESTSIQNQNIPSSQNSRQVQQRDDDETSLPTGWKAGKDHSGRTIYWDTETKRSTLNRYDMIKMSMKRQQRKEKIIAESVSERQSYDYQPQDRRVSLADLDQNDEIKSIEQMSPRRSRAHENITAIPEESEDIAGPSTQGITITTEDKPYQATTTVVQKNKFQKTIISDETHQQLNTSLKDRVAKRSQTFSRKAVKSRNRKGTEETFRGSMKQLKNITDFQSMEHDSNYQTIGQCNDLANLLDRYKQRDKGLREIELEHHLSMSNLTSGSGEMADLDQDQNNICKSNPELATKLQNKVNTNTDSAVRLPSDDSDLSQALSDLQLNEQIEVDESEESSSHHTDSEILTGNQSDNQVKIPVNKQTSVDSTTNQNSKLPTKATKMSIKVNRVEKNDIAAHEKISQSNLSANKNKYGLRKTKSVTSLPISNKSHSLTDLSSHYSGFNIPMKQEELDLENEDIITVDMVQEKIFDFVSSYRYFEDLTNASEQLKAAYKSPVLKQIILETRSVSQKRMKEKIRAYEKANKEFTPTMNQQIKKLEENREFFFKYMNHADFLVFANLLRDLDREPKLPIGWSKTNQGQPPNQKIVYIDDNSKSTTFFNPNIYFTLEKFDMKKFKEMLEKHSSSKQSSGDMFKSSESNFNNNNYDLHDINSNTHHQTNDDNNDNDPFDNMSSAENSEQASPTNEPTNNHNNNNDETDINENNRDAYDLLTEEERIVLFFTHPNSLDIIRENYPNYDENNALKSIVETIRSHGLPAYRRIISSDSLSFQFSLMMSVLDEVIRNTDLFNYNQAVEANNSDPNSETVRTLARPINSTRRRTKETNSNELQNKQANFYKKLKELKYGQSKMKLCLQNVPRKHIANAVKGAIIKAKPVVLQRCKMQIQFEGEEGIDFSGPLREMFYLVSKETFDPYKELFEYASDNQYTVQVASQVTINGELTPKIKDWFKFSGRLIGLALLHRVLLDVYFSRIFYRALLQQSYKLDDMMSIDESSYKSFKWILDNDIDELDLGLDFTADTEILGGYTITKELKDGGSEIAVTESNKQEYVDLLVRWRADFGRREAMNEIIKGFNDVLPISLVSSFFSPAELELVLCGVAEIDVDDWRHNSEYRDGYGLESQTIKDFWSILKKDFSNEERVKLLQFVTGSSGLPYEGFKGLRGPNGIKLFCVQRWGNPKVDLPRSHTCFNRIDLPDYKNRTVLLKKLRFAIHETAGFNLE